MQKWAIELTVDEKIGEESTGTPVDTVRPSFDARACLVVDKHVATDNELVPLAIIRPAGAERERTIETSFEDEHRGSCSVNVTAPCWNAHGTFSGI